MLKAGRKYLLVGAVNVGTGQDTISSVNFNITDISKVEFLTQLYTTKGSSSSGACQQNILVVNVLEDVQVRVQGYAYMTNVEYALYISAVTIN